MAPPGKRNPTAAEQFVHIRRWHGDAALRHGVITLSLVPSATSRTYVVAIDYSRMPRRPSVNSLRPRIAPGAPHLYRPNLGLDLCLFSRDEWDASMWFMETIVPWTEEWLYYYERWLEGEQWGGPEAPHGRGPKQP